MIDHEHDWDYAKKATGGAVVHKIHVEACKRQVRTCKLCSLKENVPICRLGQPCLDCVDPNCKCYHHKIGKGRKKKAKYIRAEAKAAALAARK